MSQKKCPLDRKMNLKIVVEKIVLSINIFLSSKLLFHEVQKCHLTHRPTLVKRQKSCQENYLLKCVINEAPSVIGSVL